MCAAEQSKPPTDLFSLRGPLCAGEALSPQGRGGRAALSYMARRDVGPRDRPRTSADRPHISPLVAFRKRGGYLLAPLSSCTRAVPGEWSGSAHGPGEHGRKHDDWRNIGPVTLLGYVGRPSTNVRAGHGWLYFQCLKVLRLGLWVLRSQRTYFEHTRANFFI
jgi:hypothetical protein